MKSIIQTAMYVDRSQNGVDRWCAPNTLQIYNRLDRLSRVSHLMRQSFILRYCQLVYGESPPPLIANYKDAIKELLEFETSNINKYRLQTSPENVSILEGLQFAKIFLDGKYNDYIFDVDKIVPYFIPAPIINDKNDIPQVSSIPFLKTCLNFWNNNTQLRQNRQTSINAESITMVKIPNIKIVNKTLLITDMEESTNFDSYTYSPNLIVEVNNESPIDRYDSLQSLSLCLNWTNKTLDDFTLLFAQYSLTLDVFSPISKQFVLPTHLEYRNLINAGLYQILVSKFMNKLKNPNLYSAKYCPQVINSILSNIHKLKDVYGLNINDINIINDLVNYSKKYKAIEEAKDENMHSASVYKSSILPIFYSGEAVEEEENTTDEGTDTKTTETKTTTKEGDETTVEETKETTETPETSEEPTDKEESTTDDQIPDIEIESSKKNDKSKPIVFELEKDVTLDIVLLRDEISHFINVTLEHPPENIDANDLNVLRSLKKYWINILSIKTTLDIISNIIECPIVIKKIKDK